MFRSMPFYLLAIILIATLLDPWIPYPIKTYAYALSLTLKSAIVFLLPALIFALLFKTAAQMSKKASYLLLMLLALVCISNLTSTLLSYFAGYLAYQLDLSVALPEATQELMPAWKLLLPKWFNNETSLFSGLFFGALCGYFLPAQSEKISILLEKSIKILLKAFLYIIPFFIAGFVIKMNHDGVMRHILIDYALVFLIVAGAVFSYIAFLYLLANKFNASAFAKSIQNMLPAAIAGVGSMSSAAAMPLTLIGTEKNSQNSDLARAIIPATVNIHLIGDCFAIPIFAFAVLKNFDLPEPGFALYLTFAFYFVLAKFSVAAVPGGGILVMLPILESALGFDAEMLSLITALYILFDPIITCANVLGNGGFALLVARFLPAKSVQAVIP